MITSAFDVEEDSLDFAANADAEDEDEDEDIYIGEGRCGGSPMPASAARARKRDEGLLKSSQGGASSTSEPLDITRMRSLFRIVSIRCAIVRTVACLNDSRSTA